MVKWLFQIWLTRAIIPISVEARATGTRVLGVKIKTRSVSMTCVTLWAIVHSWNFDERSGRKVSLGHWTPRGVRSQRVIVRLRGRALLVSPRWWKIVDFDEDVLASSSNIAQSRGYLEKHSGHSQFLRFDEFTICGIVPINFKWLKQIFSRTAVVAEEARHMVRFLIWVVGHSFWRKRILDGKE